MIAEMGPTSKHEERLTEMVEKYQLPLLKMCRMYLKDKASAEDAVQETFLRAYRALPQFRDECSEKTWLMRIALNICHDLAKSAWLKHTEKRITPEEMQDYLAAPEELSFGLAEEIAALPRRYKDVLLLYYYQDMPMEEVAAALGASVSTVSRRLKTARARLREQLERGQA